MADSGAAQDSSNLNLKAEAREEVVGPGNDDQTARENGSNSTTTPPAEAVVREEIEAEPQEVVPETGEGAVKELAAGCNNEKLTVDKDDDRSVEAGGVTEETVQQQQENETDNNGLNTLSGLETKNEEAELVQNTEQSVPREEEADVMKTSNNITANLSTLDLVDEGPETEEEQAAFMKELELFHKSKFLEFKPPKFYQEPLNCLKLWKAVIKLGGYEQVTACKLWRQVGESFNPPKTCTTVSWTFRGFYEKALLEYEKHKMRNGELPFNDGSFLESSSVGNQAGLGQASGSGRARRDAAARAMQGWHTQRLLGNGEVGDPIIKDKTSISTPKREKQLKSVGLLKRKKLSPVDHSLEVARQKAVKLQLETMVVDIGTPADWVKINVQKTKDCFEVYALVPGLLREEVLKKDLFSGCCVFHFLSAGLF
ncbi:OLC1v1003619C3 [Oldenlandia corymbosa var. corymbosa]|uniref:OLC1v1003619C3 n=1 Tax=Oldenlandia corymbosa var. corymbosa TaxID=529605 RepID=A0AAV1DAF5_OLDCO|nr:OLC1v1003619C3 [Oldenlandia corymbosa var. corymbosa]